MLNIRFLLLKKIHLKIESYLPKVNSSTAVPDINSNSMQPPNPKKITCDMIGPADPVSNLRRTVFKQSCDETALEKQYRLLRGEVHEWNQKFWTKHNTRYFQEREAYIKKCLPEGQQNLTADEMSVFYKSFLDKNWRNHVNYNIEWYKKNVTLLGLAIRIEFNNMLKLKKNRQVR